MSTISAIQNSRAGKAVSNVVWDYREHGFFKLKFVVLDVAILAVCVLANVH